MSTQEATATKTPRTVAGIPVRNFFIPDDNRIEKGRYNWPMIKSIVSMLGGAVGGGIVGFMAYAIPFVPTVAFVLSAPFLAVGGLARVVALMMPKGERKTRLKAIAISTLKKGLLVLGFPMVLAAVPFFAATHAALTGVEAAARKATGRVQAPAGQATEAPVAAPAVEPTAASNLATGTSLTEAFQAENQPAADEAPVAPAAEAAPKAPKQAK